MDAFDSLLISIPLAAPLLRRGNVPAASNFPGPWDHANLLSNRDLVDESLHYVESGEQSAMLMSSASSAKRHDLDVFKYVKDVLDQLLAGSTDYESLLPDVWERTHPEAVREYRVDERQDTTERKQFNAAKRRLASKAAREKR